MRSALHRRSQGYDISHLPDLATEKPAKKKFKFFSLGYFHIDIAEVQKSEFNL